MAVAVQAPQRREEKDPLDTIMKGLHIASTVYGLKDAGDKSKLLKQQLEQNKQDLDLKQNQADISSDAQERAAMGIYLPKELLDKGLVPAKEGEKGAVPFVVQEGNISGPAFYKQMPKEIDPMVIEMRNQRVVDARTKDMDSRAERLANKMQSVSDVGSAIQAVEKKIGVNLDEYGGEAVDLPGVSVPGLGRMTAHSGEARELETLVSRVFNAELKDRSGSAVTTPELERLKTEFASGRFNTEEEMLGALREYKIALRQATINIESGFPSDVVALREQRGGFTSKSLPQGAGIPKKQQENISHILGTPKANASAGAQSPGDFQSTQNKAQQLLLQKKGMSGRLPK